MQLSFSLPLVGECIRPCESSSDDPDGPAVRTEKYKAMLSVGENVLLAPTENISHKRLAEISRDDEFAQLCAETTRLTDEYAGNTAIVGGLIAPSADEKYNSGIFESLYFDYLEKITVLKDSGADFIMLANAGTLGEMRAAVLASKAADIPVFITMNCDEDGKNRSGTDYIAALITLQSIGAAAFGIECMQGAEAAAGLLKAALVHAEIPLILTGSLTGRNKKQMAEVLDCGAGIFFNTGPALDEQTVQAIKKYSYRFDFDAQKDCYAAAVDSEAFFLSDDIVLSEPITCSYGLDEDMIDLDDENINSVYIELFSTDDAAILADNSDMTRLPVTVHTNDSTTLEAALRYFRGRLIIDTRCDIDDDDLNALAKKYGAILY